MNDLTLIIDYDMNKDKFDLSGDVKKENYKDFIYTFLKTQMNTKIDDRKIEERGIYNIKMEMDLNGDIFYVTDNCGNRDLREGILMRCFEKC